MSVFLYLVYVAVFDFLLMFFECVHTGQAKKFLLYRY